MTPAKWTRTERRLHGAQLMAMGAIVALLCGLCSANLIQGLLSGRVHDGYVVWPFLPFVGGVPTVTGVVIFARGWWIRRQLRRSNDG